MPSANYLTDEDVAIIQQMIDRSLLGIQNPAADSGLPESPRLGPEIYIAKLKEGHILPALDTEEDPPIVGSANCEIYQINEDNELVAHEFRETPITRKVYNFTETEMNDEDVYFLVTRDKWGKFWYVTSDPCFPRNEIWQIFITGSPTGGTFDVEWIINGHSETLTFNWNDDAAAIAAELATHSQLENTDIDVKGGPFPNSVVNIEYIGDYAETRIAKSSGTVPLSRWGSLTGGAGVAVLVGYPQSGYPK